MAAAPLFSAPSLQLNVQRVTFYGALAVALNALRYPRPWAPLGKEEGKTELFL